MNNDVVLPKKIKVGYQKRDDTYTGKLAYIVYIDEKGVTRKETSWQSWRDTKIDPQEFDNEPTSGMVLNKKVGGYKSDWNFRQAYVRVYDPRGFEFEITVPNLLFILENTSSIKGKGLEGDFVYGWSGKDLLLIPTCAPQYQEIVKFSAGMYDKDNKIGVKNLIIGATYKSSKGEDLVYLGRFSEYEDSDYDYSKQIENAFGLEIRKNSFWFYNLNDNFQFDIPSWLKDKHYFGCFQVYASLPKLALCLDDKCNDNYANIMSCLNKDWRFKPKDEYEVQTTPYTFEDFKNYVKKERSRDTYYVYFYDSHFKAQHLHCYRGYYYGQHNDDDKFSLSYRGSHKTLKEIFDQCKPIIVKKIKKGETTNV